MAITKPTARKLATQLEWTLLESSFAPLLKDITIGRLRQKITRARKYQDKYRALERQQRGEARGKRKPKGTRPSGDNERTVQKHTLFTEARERFEGQLEKLEAREARNAKRGNTAKRAKSAPNATSTKRATAAKNAKSTKRAKTGKKASGTSKRGASRDVQPVSDVMDGALTKREQLRARQTARQAMSEHSMGARKQAALEQTGAIAHQAHVGSRGRRRQSRRDSR